MRYILIGAGAVGGTIGGRLHAAGREVLLIARGDHHRVLRTRGLRLMLPQETLELPVPVADDPTAVELRPDDVLVLAVKTQDSVAALDTWASLPVRGGGTAGERLPLVCAQNGVANERLALRRFRTVLGMCVWLPATFLEPGVVLAPCAPMTGILHLGRYPSGPEAVAEPIAADLTAAGFLAPVSPDVMRWKYAKLLANLGNAVEAATGPIDTPQARELASLARAEGEAALAAAGIRYADAAEEQAARGDLARPVPMAGRQGTGGSSWQSLSRGTGSIEADYLNGEIVLLGRTHGVRTPVNEALQRVANEFARLRRAPGELTVDQLRAVIAQPRADWKAGR
jgi:2-dehydropantoate 2-reductase